MAQQGNKGKGREKKHVNESDYPSSDDRDDDAKKGSESEAPAYSDSPSRSTDRYDNPNDPPCPQTKGKDDKDNKDDDNDVKNNDDNDTGDIQGDIDNYDDYTGYYIDNDNNNGGNHSEKNKHGEGSCGVMEYKKLAKKNKILRKKIKIMELKEEKSKLMLKIADIDKKIELEKLKLKYMM